MMYTQKFEKFIAIYNGKFVNENLLEYEERWFCDAGANGADPCFLIDGPDERSLDKNNLTITTPDDLKLILKYLLSTSWSEIAIVSGKLVDY